MGVEKFFVVFVMVIDLCVFFFLVLVVFVVDGEMLIDCIYYIDCGYEDVEVKL